MTRHQRGSGLVEIMIAVLIVGIGVIGLAGLQAKMITGQMEAYQRAQAVVLMNDIVARMAANYAIADSYILDAVNGQTIINQSYDNTAVCAGATPAQIDLCAVSNSIKGVGERSAGAAVGGMVGTVGCIVKIVGTTPQVIRISVAWQGMSGSAANTGDTCGQGTFGADDALRRVISTTFALPTPIA